MIASPIRVLFHSSNRRGLGHFMRSRNIAEAILDMEPRAAILVAGRGRFPSEFACGRIQYAAANDQDAVTGIARAVATFRPHVRVDDTMLPADSTAERNGKVRRVYVMRKCRPERQAAILESSFLREVDLVVVPHTRDEFTHALPDDVRKKTVFVGPIVRRPNQTGRRRVRAEYQLKDDDFVLVSTPGGGGFQEHADAFFDLAFRVHQLLVHDQPRLRHIVVQGPKYGGTLCPLPGMTVVRCEPELVNLFAEANWVISAGGYNTVNELRVTGTPAILLPSPRTHDDQQQRVSALVRQGFAETVDARHSDEMARRIVRLCRDREVADRLRDRCQREPVTVGNHLAARHILDLVQL